MPDPIQTPLLCNTAKEFVSTLRPSDGLWEGDDAAQCGWVFRGQSCAGWDLEAAAFRKPSGGAPTLYDTFRANYTRRYRADLGFTPADWIDWLNPAMPPGGAPPGWEATVEEVGLLAVTHAAMVRDFALMADRAGHETPRPDFLWHLTDRARHPEALRAYFAGNVDQADLATFAVAQHHGIPTTLLDWTYNPLVAAYFAAEPLSRPKPPPVSSGQICVWALRSALFRHNLPELVRVTVPPGRVPFLDAQDALFIWCRTAYPWWIDRGCAPTVQDAIREIDRSGAASAVPRPWLRQVWLPVSEAIPLLQLLWREQVTPAHLMPSYDNVTASLRLRATWHDHAD